MAVDLLKGRKTLDEKIGWLPFSLKYSMALDRVSVYSPAFFGYAIASEADFGVVIRWLLDSFREDLNRGIIGHFLHDSFL
jgi:hypothetical protein